MVGWENLSPAMLAQDIKKYVDSGQQLETIKQDALSQGIPESLWDQALSLAHITQSSAADMDAADTLSPTIPTVDDPSEETSSQPTIKFTDKLPPINTEGKTAGNKGKKLSRQQIMALVFAGIALIGGGFLVFQWLIKPAQPPALPTIEKPLGEKIIVPEKEPIEDIIEVDPIPITKEDASQKISNPDFRSKVEAGEIIIDVFEETPGAFQSFVVIHDWIKEHMPTYNEIETLEFVFDKDGNALRNYARIFDQGRPRTLSINTLSPYELPHSVIYHTSKEDEQRKPEFIITDWGALFEKVKFAEQDKKNLTFQIKVYKKEETKFVRVDFVYPDEKKNARIEIDFFEFNDILGNTKIAFGRNPKASIGFFTEQYPIRTGPKPARE